MENTDKLLLKIFKQAFVLSTCSPTDEQIS